MSPDPIPNPAQLLQRGRAFHETGNTSEAAACYRQILELQPDHADALHLLGLVELQRNDPKAAIVAIRKALAADDGRAVYYNSLGLVLTDLQQLQPAVEAFDRAIALDPALAEANNNRGLALRELGLWDEAVASFDRAIAITPNAAEPYNNRGMVLMDQGKLEEAMASFDLAYAIDSQYFGALWNKSLCLLLAGRWEEAWPLHEWRWKVTPPTRAFAEPLWLGAQSLRGKSILLHSEQGLGDTIQFARYIKLVADLGARTIVEVDRPLVTLIEAVAGVGRIIERGAPLPPFDFQCPLLSLPLAFKTTPANLPHAPSYLKASAVKTAYWARKLGPKGRPRIGVVWSGNPTHKNDRHRSIPLADFAHVFSEHFDFFSLQKDTRPSDQDALLRHPRLRHFGDSLESFLDSAALCDLMDLVISVDTSLAHLAGALGKSVWILLPSNPDWRWSLDGDRTPWYPSARLCRQQRPNDWAAVLRKVKADLSARFAAP